MSFESRLLWGFGAVVAVAVVGSVVRIVTAVPHDEGPETDAAYCTRRCASEGGVAMGWETRGRHSIPYCRCEVRASDGGAP